MGAVAYDPKVVDHLGRLPPLVRRDHGLDFDFVLYSNYERQVTGPLDGRIHAGWNSPLAWVRARRLAEAAGTEARALAMRDTDRDLSSVVVVRADSPSRGRRRPGRAHRRHRGRRLAPGHVAPARPSPRQPDSSPTATSTVRRFDIGVGLHGDHIGGEREARPRPDRR